MKEKDRATPFIGDGSDGILIILETLLDSKEDITGEQVTDLIEAYVTKRLEYLLGYIQDIALDELRVNVQHLLKYHGHDQYGRVVIPLEESKRWSP